LVRSGRMGLPLPVLIRYVGLSWLGLAGVHFRLCKSHRFKPVRSVPIVADDVAPCSEFWLTPRRRLATRPRTKARSANPVDRARERRPKPGLHAAPTALPIAGQMCFVRARAVAVRFTSSKNQIARARQMPGPKQPAVIIGSEGVFIMRLRWVRRAAREQTN
jgi:hypothetical protein